MFKLLHSTLLFILFIYFSLLLLLSSLSFFFLLISPSSSFLSLLLLPSYLSFFFLLISPSSSFLSLLLLVPFLPYDDAVTFIPVSVVLCSEARRNVSTISLSAKASTLEVTSSHRMRVGFFNKAL